MKKIIKDLQETYRTIFENIVKTTAKSGSFGGKYKQ